MADNVTVVTDPKAKDEKTEKPIGQEVRDKSFEQILREQRDEATKPLEEKAPAHSEEEDKKADEERLAKEAEEARRKIEEEEQAKKRDSEIAKNAADEVLARQKAEEQAKLDALKKEEEAKKHEEELKPKFTGKDQEGNVVPKSYDEIAQESARIAKEEAIQALRLEQAQRESEAKVAMEEKAKAEKVQAEQKKSFEDQLQKELDSDLNDLYLNNKLPKIKDPKNENDPGNKEFKNLFETAQKVNGERMAKGLPPIRSIKLIYYEHYKPLGNPAGHDAPVMGNESTISNEAPEDRYIPSRDRGKSMTQLLKEEAQRLGRKMNIRGN